MGARFLLLPWRHCFHILELKHPLLQHIHTDPREKSQPHPTQQHLREKKASEKTVPPRCPWRGGTPGVAAARARRPQ